MEREYNSRYRNAMRIILCCVMYINIHKIHNPFRVTTVSLHGKKEYQYYH